MAKKKVKLNIKTACSKDWNSFSKKGSIGYCSHCSKTVIDFTRATEQEIFQAVTKSKNKVCGRLNVAQLNREICDVNSQTNSSHLSKVFAGLLILGTTQSVIANEVQPFPTNSIGISASLKDTLQRGTIQESNNFIKDTSSNYIEGRILDKNSTPISFASIIIKDTKYGVTADKEGKFKIIVPNTLLKTKIIIKIFAVGYEPKEFAFKKSKLPIKNDFIIKMTEAVMGEIAIISVDK